MIEVKTWRGHYRFANAAVNRFAFLRAEDASLHELFFRHAISVACLLFNVTFKSKRIRYETFAFAGSFTPALRERCFR
jgi:hypothetical protein